MSTQPAARRPRTALITGASGGLGYEFSKLFARDGYQVILVARGADKLREVADELQQTYGAQTLVIGKDLSETGAAQGVYEAVQEQGWAVDALVNNAGYTVF